MNAADSQARAVVLLSGGLDSAVVLAEAHKRGRQIHALSFSYGQRHASELDAARSLARRIGVAEHIVLEIDLRAFGASALTDAIDVPKNDLAEDGTVPVTYVPARNTIFLSLALAHAEARGAREIWIGVNAIDFSGYPDCRPQYIAAFETMARLATRDGVEGRGVSIVAPLQELGKGAIVKRACELGVPMQLTHSCYDPESNGQPCSACDACILRARGFEEAGCDDPALAPRAS